MAWRDGLIVLLAGGGYLLWLRAFIASHPVDRDARLDSKQLRAQQRRRAALRAGR